jgi:hypothetical protein
MLYRPQFCCHCGEKIIRARWTPLTSRRFCDFCEIEQKQHDLIPRAAMCIAVLVGAAGVTAYLAGGGPEPSRHPEEVQSRGSSRTLTEPTAPKSNVASSPANVAPVNIEQRGREKNSSTETVYYCGALTKKGTPCTRRVKTKGRCWQHTGRQPVEDSRD